MYDEDLKHGVRKGEGNIWNWEEGNLQIDQLMFFMFSRSGGADKGKEKYLLFLVIK